VLDAGPAGEPAEARKGVVVEDEKGGHGHRGTVSAGRRAGSGRAARAVSARSWGPADLFPPVSAARPSVWRGRKHRGWVRC